MLANRPTVARGHRPRFAVVLACLATHACALNWDQPVDVRDGDGDDARTEADVRPDSGDDGDLHPDDGTEDDSPVEISDGDVVDDAGACDPAEVPGDEVFVSDADGSDMNDGTRLRPFKTIGVAIGVAIASGMSAIYIDEDTYNEAVVLPDTSTGLFLEGGWIATGATWMRDCEAGVTGRTVIAAPESASVAVTAEGVRHASGLRLLTVTTKARGASLPDASGESLAGVLVRGDGSVFSLTDVAVVAGRAGDGGPASATANGATGGAPGTCGPCVTGALGAPATESGSPAATSGTFTASGYTPVDGTAGSPGTAGENGTAGGAGTSSSDCVAGCGPDCASCGVEGGRVTRAGAQGSCGCGGGGGGAGSAGGGGGASVALLVIGTGATVSVERGRLEAGDGGNGSDGGLQGDGGTGSLGAMGAASSCDTACHTGGACTPGSCYSGTAVPLAGGAAGGLGGGGGAGSPGGAGSGGPSYAVVRVGGALVVLRSSPESVFGSGGAGAGSAPGGAAGAMHTAP